MSLALLEPAPADPDSRPELLDELQRILDSPFFRTSKRCSNMLRYIVEHATSHPDVNVKERTSGIEVFGRSPDYDTTADPVVRTTAGEIRKRLAQYFTIHPDADFIITLPPGSYHPVIRERTLDESRAESSALPLRSAETLGEQQLPQQWIPQPVRPAVPDLSARRRSSRLLWLLSSVLLIGVAFAAWKFLHRSGLEAFWNPITSSGKQPNICLGDLTTLVKPGTTDAQALATAQTGLVKTGPGSRDQLALADVAALNGVAGYLAVHGLSGIVFNAASASFAQLRDQPLILIGGRSNQWTMREMTHLPFQIVNGPADRVVGIRDIRKGNAIRWMVDFNMPYEQVKKEYAVIARFRNPETNQPTVVIAGVGANGTVAASDFITHPENMSKLSIMAPGWEKRNVELVLETDMINGDYAQPQVLDVATW